MRTHSQPEDSGHSPTTTNGDEFRPQDPHPTLTWRDGEVSTQTPLLQALCYPGASRRAFDLGITTFDLANNYGPPYGSAEDNFGRIFVADLSAYRHELVISTKAGYDM